MFDNVHERLDFWGLNLTMEGQSYREVPNHSPRPLDFLLLCVEGRNKLALISFLG